jgi:hypothetical protein
LTAGGMKLGGSVLVGAAGENVGNLIMSGQKSLHLARRLEALHDPLSSSRRLVAILRPIVEAFVLAVLDAGHDLPLGSRIAFQLVSDQHTGRSSLLLQQFTEQAFAGLLIASALDKHIEKEALLVNRAPEPVLLAGDGDDDLVQVPLVATTRSSPTDAAGKFRRTSGPTAGSSHMSPRCRQHLLDHAQAQRKSKIQPDRITDELSGVAIASVDRVSERRHPGQIPDHPSTAKPKAAQLDGAL